MASSTTVATPSATKRAGAGKGTSTAPANGNGVAPAGLDAVDSKSQDFFWTYTEEPHRTRRLAIIKAHPEVRDLPLRREFQLPPLANR
jgi:hypothetical protein